MPSEQEPIPITNLGLQELRQVRERVETDTQRLQQSRMQLQRVVTSFSESLKAIGTLKSAEQGQEILLPLSASLYISGNLESVDEVLVDIGTGYFAERPVDDAMDYCKRKAEKVQASIKELGQAIGEKQKVMTHINQVMMTKQEGQAQAQNQAKAGPSLKTIQE
ncbi:hypothetical protein BSKO_12592 [Bryopsis sp. KO-2023]|nr:hypothetical protein BSKO_12592 [Bryopsis sp. KO-2023]